MTLTWNQIQACAASCFRAAQASVRLPDPRGWRSRGPTGTSENPNTDPECRPNCRGTQPRIVPVSGVTLAKTVLECLWKCPAYAFHKQHPAGSRVEAEAVSPRCRAGASSASAHLRGQGVWWPFVQGLLAGVGCGGLRPQQHDNTPCLAVNRQASGRRS